MEVRKGWGREGGGVRFGGGGRAGGPGETVSHYCGGEEGMGSGGGGKGSGKETGSREGAQTMGWGQIEQERSGTEAVSHYCGGEEEVGGESFLWGALGIGEGVQGVARGVGVGVLADTIRREW